MTTTRNMAKELHPPQAVYAMLLLMLLASTLYAGYAMAGSKSHSFVHTSGFLLTAGRYGRGTVALATAVVSIMR